VGVAGALLSVLFLPAEQASAADASVGFSQLSYLCPTPAEIDFAWSPAANAAFYSLQLVLPLDQTVNGGISGTYLRQFGTIELLKAPVNNATVTLASGSLGAPPLTLTFQVMQGGQDGYTGLVPAQQVVRVPTPCLANTIPVSVAG
jgi:hypothetical protein